MSQWKTCCWQATYFLQHRLSYFKFLKLYIDEDFILETIMLYTNLSKQILLNICLKGTDAIVWEKDFELSEIVGL